MSAHKSLCVNMFYIGRRGLINYKDTKAKCRHLKLTALQQVFIYPRPLPLLGFSLGWSSNFVGSESGQIQSVKLLQNIVSNKTQHPQPPPSHTLSVPMYFTLTQTKQTHK